MFILIENLKLLKNNLKYWNKIKVAASNTESIQTQISTIGFSDSLMDQEKLAKIKFHEAVKFEEEFRQENAKVKWHMEGDRNTRYFHKIAKVRCGTKKKITSLSW